MVALGKPSNHDEASWYFQRYVPHLPSDGEMVRFNRSWYNRAGVERVMGFCTAGEYEAFLDDAPAFESLLVRSGIVLWKSYLDISKDEQERRLADRRKDPLAQWKVSPIDEVAVENWKKYTAARDQMLANTHVPTAPWDIVRTDNKHVARLEVIKSLLSGIDYKGKNADLLEADPEVLFRFGPDPVESMLAP